jgi:Leucine-rich repeat (LRR) protein
MALIRLKNFATEFSGSFSFGMGATFDSLTQNVEISQRHSERSRPYKSVLISSVCNSTTPSAFQRLRNDTLYCDVCCDLFTEPKLLELPFDDVTQFCHYYRTYFQRFETNILPQCNILCDDIVIPVNYSQLPYNLKNPLFRHWSFLCGGEKFLDLSDLAMNELVDEACKRRSLRGLNLSKNKLDYLSVRRFTRLTNLDTLNLDHNQFTVFPSAVISLTSLTKLSFSHNAITHLPREISMLTNLKNFRAEFNQLQDLPHSFSTLIRLEKLALTGNHWKNPSSIWTTLFSFTSLRCLLLADSHLTEIPAQVSVLTKLKVLDCSKNFISVLPESLATLKNLQILRLGYNRIKSIPNAIMKLQSITRLELNNNEIEQISLTLWSAISKRATLILEHNPLPLNFIKHRKSSLKSSATTSPPLIRQVRESKLQSVNVSGSPKRLGTNDSPWDRTLRSFSSPTMLSSAPTDGEKNEIKKSQSSSSTINTTEKPQIVVVSISSPKKMRIPKTGTPKLQDTNSDETPHTTECSLSYPSAKASMNGVDQNNVSSVSAKSKFSGHREEEKQRLQKDSSDTTSESSRFSVSADTTEQQASSSIESSPNTTPFSSPRRSGPGGLSSSSQLDLDDIDNEVILGGASHNVLKSKLKPKLKTNEKEKLKDKAKLKTNEKDRNEKKMATNKKLERSYSTAVVANNTKNATTDTPDHNNIDNDDDNREMSLLEFLAQVSPTTTRKKTLEDNSKMKRTASVSVIKKRITSKKDDNQQLKEKSKIEKKDKKENKKEMEPSSKWPKSFLSRIGKRKAVAETRKQNQQARSDDHRNTKISHSVPSTPKKSASTPDSNPPSMRRGTVSVERPHEPPLSATVTKRKRGNSTENPPPLQTLSPENAMRPTPSPASEHLKSSASISSSTRSSHKEQLPSSKKEYFAREDKSGPQTTSRNLSSLISPRRTPDPLDFHFRTPTDITTSAASTKLGVDSLSNSPGTHMLDTTKRMRRFDSVRVRSKEQIQTLAQLKTDVKLSPFISRKRKSIKSVSRIDFSSLPPIKEKTFIDFLTADSKVLQIQHRPEGATVVAATADALVELLTHDKGKDARFENAFILAFPSVMTPSTLFELLIRRYHSASVHKDQQKSAVIREKYSSFPFSVFSI